MARRRDDRRRRVLRNSRRSRNNRDRRTGYNMSRAEYVAYGGLGYGAAGLASELDQQIGRKEKQYRRVARLVKNRRRLERIGEAKATEIWPGQRSPGRKKWARIKRPDEFKQMTLWEEGKRKSIARETKIIDSKFKTKIRKIKRSRKTLDFYSRKARKIGRMSSRGLYGAASYGISREITDNKAAQAGAVAATVALEPKFYKPEIVKQGFRKAIKTKTFRKIVKWL